MSSGPSSPVSPLFAIPLLLLSACGTLSAGQAFLRAAAESNVNQRYTIESVSVAGVQLEDARLPSTLRQRLNALIGERCDVAMLEELAAELRKELHLRDASEHLSRGSDPDRIRVNFEIVKKPVAFDISVPKFLFHSSQGWTGEVDAGARVGQNSFTLGVVSNGDDLTERFAGMSARYGYSKVGSDRVQLGVAFEDYHEQWSDATRTAAALAPGHDLYRTRRNIAPSVTLAIAKSLTVSAGMSFEQMGSESPAVGQTSANAFTVETQFRRDFEGDSLQQVIDGRYTLRAATRALGSDYSYSRHTAALRYEVKWGRQTASDAFTVGTIIGSAPLFERFVLGTSSTLRAWDRYSINPLGGDRLVHNSLAWSYQLGDRTGEIFYDTGTLGNAGRQGPVRHSVGVGYRQGIFVLTMAFPVVDGRIAPVFMAGMNY